MEYFKGAILIGLSWLFFVTTVQGQGYELDVLSNQSFCPFIPIADCENQDLQARLGSQLKTNPKWEKLIRNRQMAVGLVDMNNEDDIRFACVNCDHMMYAASLPKIAILLAAMEAFEDGSLEETDEIIADLNLMIRRSNNRASTRMIDRLGFEKIASVITDPRYELYNPQKGGGLWVGKRYASSGKRNPDPMKGLSHAATVNQVCRFYYLLARGKLVSEERSKQMLDILADPALHHKFVNTLEAIAPEAKLYRKSGTWKTYHADSVLVWGPEGRQYILTAMVNDPGGEAVMRQLVKEVEIILKS